MLELSVKVININLPANHKLLEQCRPLYEYSWFIQRIKTYIAKERDLDKAITQTIKDCEKEGIMVDFVRKHGSEAVNMLFTQFNMDDALEVRYEEGFEDGFENGAKRGEMLKLIQQVCGKLKKGKKPQQIAEELEEELALVQKICAAIESCETNEDVSKVYDTLQTLL